MAKHYRCRGFVNGKVVTIKLDAESELDAINKFHQQFVTEGHDPSTVERIAVKEKGAPKESKLRFGMTPEEKAHAKAEREAMAAKEEAKGEAKPKTAKKAAKK